MYLDKQKLIEFIDASGWGQIDVTARPIHEIRKEITDGKFDIQPIPLTKNYTYGYAQALGRNPETIQPESYLSQNIHTEKNIMSSIAGIEKNVMSLSEKINSIHGMNKEEIDSLKKIINNHSLILSAEMYEIKGDMIKIKNQVQSHTEEINANSSGVYALGNKVKEIESSLIKSNEARDSNFSLLVKEIERTNKILEHIKDTETLTKRLDGLNLMVDEIERKGSRVCRNIDSQVIWLKKELEQQKNDTTKLRIEVCNLRNISTKK